MYSMLGTILPMAYDFAPRGWALCQGQLLNISQNQALYALLGTSYGGDGKTTFALPDLRGRKIVGQGNSPTFGYFAVGQKAGVESITLSNQTMPAHTHQVTLRANTNPGGVDATNAYFAGGAKVYTAQPFNSSLNAAEAVVGIQGGSQPFSILNPYLTMNYSIATTGFFPSRN